MEIEKNLKLAIEKKNLSYVFFYLEKDLSIQFGW